MPPHNRKYKTTGRKGPDTSTWTPEERRKHVASEMLKTPVAEMQLAVRIINTLEENDVIMVDDLMAQTYDSLMKMKNFGEKTLTEVRDAVSALGLTPPVWQKPPKPKKTPRGRRNGPKATRSGGFAESIW